MVLLGATLEGRTLEIDGAGDETGFCEVTGEATLVESLRGAELEGAGVTSSRDRVGAPVSAQQSEEKQLVAPRVHKYSHIKIKASMNEDREHKLF